MDHVTALPCLVLGLDGFRLLAATEHRHELMLLVETTTDRDFCRTRGVRAGSKGRARTIVRDVPIAGRPTVLVWKKRIWRCEQLAWSDIDPRLDTRAACQVLAGRWSSNSANTTKRCAALWRGWQVVRVSVGTPVPSGSPPSTQVSEGATICCLT